MPVIHAPLNDEDFVDLAIMAREKGMTRSALAAHILIAAIRKAGRAHESAFTEASLKDAEAFETRDAALRLKTRDEAKKFNAQGLPLAKKLKEIPTMSVDGTPMVTMYERQ